MLVIATCQIISSLVLLLPLSPKRLIRPMLYLEGPLLHNSYIMLPNRRDSGMTLGQPLSKHYFSNIADLAECSSEL